MLAKGVGLQSGNQSDVLPLILVSVGELDSGLGGL